MSLLEALLEPRLIGAVLTYVLLSLALLFLGHRLLDRVEDVPVTGWLAEHVALPLLRVLAIIGFLVVAYPVVFGRQDLPPLSAVFTASPGRVMTLVNVLFMLSVLLAVVPRLGDLRAIVLPLQGMAACALLFSWVAGDAVSIWPGWEVSFAVMLWAAATYAIGGWLLHRLGSVIDGHWRLVGARAMLVDALMLVFQLPAILLYSLTLGDRLGNP